MASLATNKSPRTDNSATDSQLAYQEHLVYYMYVAIAISGCTALGLLILTFAGINRYTIVPIHRPLLLWSDRKRIKESLVQDYKNLTRRRRNKKPKTRLPKSEKEAIATNDDTDSAAAAATDDVPYRERLKRRRYSLFRLLANLTALLVLLIVVVIVPATWIVFVVWIEWWIHRDFVTSETPAQVGQWGPAVSIALVFVSALIMRLKYLIASGDEVEGEIAELRVKLEELERLKEQKGNCD